MDKPVLPKETNPVKAIRAFCLSCCMEQPSEVKLCAADECPLWEFRMGKNPYRKRQMTDEQREAARLRMLAANSAKKSPGSRLENDDHE